ncbi:hypothetical protein NPIL_507071 [Nephila pilipes]|uniref:Uncharacterized protein n=1 Tax=Nephila pilipes TaxID=299642 RepID=A0A8X6NLQ1_NEPPI|nr:hypothetical protein NPIL_507071 [Nephila pilipes]
MCCVQFPGGYKINVWYVTLKSMCSTYPPPKEITFFKRITNPATAKSRMSGLLHDSSRWITSFNSDRLVGQDRYTWDFKYPYSQKSAVKQEFPYPGTPLIPVNPT